MRHRVERHHVIGDLLDASGLPDVFVGFEPLPAPDVDQEAPLQMQVMALQYDEFKGKIAISSEMEDTMGFFLMAKGKQTESFTDADFDQADVGFHVRDAPAAVQRELAAASGRRAIASGLSDAPDQERERVEEVLSLRPCAACASRLPMEQMHGFGEDADGRPLLLCGPCRKLVT